MSIQILEKPTIAHDPLEALEAVAGLMEIEVERVDDAELHLAVPGAWRDAGVWFTWRPEVSTLQLGAPLDIKAPSNRVGDAAKLVTLVNERLWVGHFDLWSEDLAIVYRNGIILSDDAALDPQQAQNLISATAEAVDRFYPAFNYLVWGGKSPEDALKASLFDTVGSA